MYGYLSITLEQNWEKRRWSWPISGYVCPFLQNCCLVTESTLCPRSCTDCAYQTFWNQPVYSPFSLTTIKIHSLRKMFYYSPIHLKHVPPDPFPFYLSQRADRVLTLSKRFFYLLSLFQIISLLKIHRNSLWSTIAACITFKLGIAFDFIIFGHFSVSEG